MKCVAGLGLHGDDTDRGGECKAEARRESPTSDGGEHRVEIRHLLDQFDAQRGLPCHREWCIVRVDLQCIDRSGTCVASFLGIVIELTDDVDQCTLSPKAVDLRWGRDARNKDLSLHAKYPGGTGNSDPVVAA